MAENQIAEEYKKNTEHRFTNLLSRVSVVGLLVFGAIVLIAYSITKNNNDKNVNYIIYGVLIVIILVLWLKPNKDKKLLPRHVAVKIAQRELNEMLKEGKEFSFDSKVNVTAYSHLVWENDMTNQTSGYTHWDIGFEELVHGSQYKKIGVIGIHCYEGFCTGISACPFGYDGTQTHNKDIIPVGVVQGNIKTTDFGGQVK